MSPPKKTKIRKPPPSWSYLVTPLFFAVAVLHFFDRYFLRWEVVMLLILGALPALLPILAYYITGFTEKGMPIMRDPSEDSIEVDEADKISNEMERPAPQPLRRVENAKVTPSDLSAEENKVLRTLWTFQKKHFGPNATTTWGFKIRPSGDSFLEFRKGSVSLMGRRFVTENDQGLVFLTSSGMSFCRSNDPQIGSDDIWKDFGPIES